MAIKRGKVKSQTAIEYLITYGWVIIVIAVILGGLIALGVFNPSSYVTSNTCIITPDFNCNTAILSENGILFLNLQQATSSPINITSIACSTNSSTNTVTRVSPQVYLGSGENHTFELPCYSNGYQFSGHLGDIYHGYIIVNYTNVEYDIQHISVGTLILKVQVALPVTTTTTITTTTSTSSTSTSTTSTTSTSTTSSIPPSVTYVPITLSNAQGVPTPAPFQQMISFDPSSYSSYESADLGNIRFYQGSTELYSWCESGCTNSSSDAVFWVNLPSGISANSNTVINMDFESVGANYDGVFAGEAPQLSPTYGEYDNGADVFTKYGGGGSNGWSQFTFVGGTWTTVNGYLQQISTSGGYAGGPTALIESTVYPNSGSYVIGMAFNYTTKADARVGIVAVATPTTAPDTYAYRFIGQQGDNGVGFLSFLNDMVAWVVDNSYQGSVSTPYTMVVTDAAGTWSGSLYSGYGEGTAPLTSLSPRSYTAANDKGATSGYVGISAAYYSGSVSADPVNIMWFYLRAYPPGGVMPGASFG